MTLVQHDSLTNLCPTEHVTNWHCLAQNAFAMFIQVFHDELLNMHLQRRTRTHLPSPYS